MFVIFCEADFGGSFRQLSCFFGVDGILLAGGSAGELDGVDAVGAILPEHA